jgi:hypothetical protein
VAIMSPEPLNSSGPDIADHEDGGGMHPKKAKQERDTIIAPYLETIYRLRDAAVPDSDDYFRLKVIGHTVEMVDLNKLDTAESVVGWHQNHYEEHLARMASLE